jgi:hypothetical protein
MDRRRSLVVDRLEERTLLSSVSYSLTTSQSIYQVGQPVNLTFTETNTGDEPVTVSVSPTDFTISQNNSAIWQSDSTVGNVPSTSEALAPGQSLSQTASWNGIWDDSLPYGEGSATPINAYGTFTVSNPNAPQGLSATFQIANPIVYSVTTNQPVYQLGAPIQITWTAVNTADQPITIFVAPAGLSVTHNGKLLTSQPEPQIIGFPVTFAVGQTETGQETWNGFPYTGPYTDGDLSGTFIAGYGPLSDPTQYSTPFQIEALPAGELVTSVTANQATYQSGQSIDLTFTETNDGDQPVAVLTGTTEFEATEAGSSAEFFVTPTGSTEWTTAGTPPAQVLPTWTTLQPGQSYTQTATWQNLEVPSTTTFTVSNVLDPNDSTATFQVISPQSGVPSGPSTPLPSTSPVAASLTTGHDRYQLGQSVRIALTLKDQSTASRIAVTKVTHVETVTVQDGSAVVYQSKGKALALTANMIRPGHPLELVTRWPGKANQAGSKKLTPGTYTITVDDDGYVASTAVQLTARRI